MLSIGRITGPSASLGDASGSLGTRSGSATQKGLAAQGTGSQLSPEDQAKVQALQQRDREVRQHEQAHLAAASGYAQGGAKYTYTTGPDGRQYATGGEVSIDVSSAGTPEATVQKMETVKRAAVAPANPSSQDHAVYAEAVRAELAAQQEAAKEKQTAPQGASVNAYLGAAQGAQAQQAAASLIDVRA